MLTCLIYNTTLKSYLCGKMCRPLCGGLEFKYETYVICPDIWFESASECVDFLW